MADRLIEEREFAFQVDSEGMLRKVKKYLLSDPLDYVKELAAMSVLTGAKSISVRTSPWNFSIEDDGSGISQQDIESLLSRLFIAEASGDEHDGFAMAVISALEGGAERVEIDSVKDNAAVHFSIDKEYDMQFSEGDRKRPGTKVMVIRPKLADPFKLAATSRKETEKVQQSCSYLPAELRFNGKSLERKRTLEGVIAQVEVEGKEYRLLLGLERKGSKDGITPTPVALMRGGICYDEVKVYDNSAASLRARLDSKRFRLTLSRNEIVLGSKEMQFITKVLDSHLDDLTLEVCKAYDGLKAEDKERAQAYLFHQALSTLCVSSRRDYHESWQPELKTDAQRALSQMKLFRTASKNELTLMDLFAMATKDRKLRYMTQEELKKVAPFGYSSRIEQPDSVLILTDKNAGDMWVKLPVRKYEPPAPKRWEMPKIEVNPFAGVSSKLDDLARQFNESRELQKKEFQEQLRKVQSPLERLYYGLSERWEKRWSSWSESVDRFEERGGDKLHSASEAFYEDALKPAGRAAGAVLSGTAKAAVAAVGLLFSPIVYLLDSLSEKRYEARERHILRKDERDWERQEKRIEKAKEQEERKAAREAPRLEREKQRALQAANEQRKRDTERARVFGEFVTKVSGLFTTYGSDELREMFNLAENVSPSVMTGRSSDETESAFFLRRGKGNWDGGYYESNGPTHNILAINSSHPLTAELPDQMQAENAEHMLFPVIYHQLLRNYKKQELPEEVYVHVLVETEKREMDDIAQDAVGEFVSLYASQQSSDFIKGYEPLAPGMRRRVLEAVLTSNADCGAIDEYLSKNDPDLVHEVGSLNVKEEAAGSTQKK